MQTCQDGLDTLLSIVGAIPNSPFATLDRPSSGLWAGAFQRDLWLILRSLLAMAVFGTLYSLDDPGVDGDDVFMLFEAASNGGPSRNGGPTCSATENLDFSNNDK